jgi:membrane protein required for colicin V production
LLEVCAVNAVDITVLVVLGLTFVYGLFRGFVLQLAGIVFIVVGLVLADRFSPAFGATLHGWFENLGNPVDHYVAFAAIFIGTLVVGHILALIFRGLLEKLKLLSYDRFLGGILGVLKGAIILSLVLHGLLWMFDREEEPSSLARSIYESRTWPIVDKVTETVLPVIPEELRNKTREQFEKIEQEVEKRQKD